MPDSPTDSTTGSRADERPLAVRLEEQRRLARRLGPYGGRWVAVKGDQVIADASSLRALMDRLRELDRPTVDRCFRVLTGKRLLLSRA
jgi:hypothetical protein